MSSIMNATGFGAPSSTVLPAEIVTAIEDCNFWESIPLWAVTLIGRLVIWVLSLCDDFERLWTLFKMYMYAALAPHPLVYLCRGTQPKCGQELSQKLRRSLSGGAVIVLACIIFSVFASSPPVVDPDAAAASMV